MGIAIVRQLIALYGGTTSAATAGSRLGSELMVRLPPTRRPSSQIPLIRRTRFFAAAQGGQTPRARILVEVRSAGILPTPFH